jgi:hypothetical protein
MNFIEGEGIQAMCLAKVSGLDGPSVYVAVVTNPLESSMKDIVDKRRI